MDDFKDWKKWKQILDCWQFGGKKFFFKKKKLLIETFLTPKKRFCRIDCLKPEPQNSFAEPEFMGENVRKDKEMSF